MDKPKISSYFTTDDIHRIREFNHEMTKNMTFTERKKYYEDRANKFKSNLKNSNQLLVK